jgi:hypothetical protein
MTRSPSAARDLLWQALVRCAGARWQALARLSPPRRSQRSGESERIGSLVRLIQSSAHQRLAGSGATPAGAVEPDAAVAALALEVALAFQHLRLAEQRLLLGQAQEAAEHAQRFVQALLAAAVSALGQGFSAEEQALIEASSHFLPGRLAAQLELRQVLRRGALPDRLILVLGMHRSGTSAVGGMLSQAGFDAPSDLMDANAVNPRGYWESQGLFRLHEALLARLGSAWDQPERLPPGWEDSEATRTWRQETLRHLEIIFSGAKAPLVKDPRLCLLLPGWMPWLESGLLRVEMVLTLRHPLEVASSLAKAQNLPIQEGLRLWLEHVLAAERISRGWPRVIVPFDALIQQPEASLNRCLRLLARKGESAALNRAAGDFVLADLHRQRRAQLEGSVHQELLSIASARDLALAIHELLASGDINTATTAARLDALGARWQLLRAPTRTTLAAPAQAAAGS